MKSLYKVWKSTRNDKKNKENYIRKFNEGGKFLASIECVFNSKILVNSSGVLYNTPINSEYFFIPIENIKKVGIRSDEDLDKKMTPNKIHMIGELTFPRNNHLFIRINYTENNIGVEKTVETKMAVFAVSSIVKARELYVKKYPKNVLSEFNYSMEPSSLSPESDNMDIPDQINSLFKLVEKGALSKEEFDQKKKELLSRM